MASSETKVTLKLLIDKKSSKVLFAEADKGFVDFLFSIMALPIGTVTHLLKQNEGMVGSLGSLHESIENLSNSYIASDGTKDAVLRPKVILPGQAKLVPLLTFDNVAYDNVESKTWYKCQSCMSASLTAKRNTTCNSCRDYMSVKVEFPVAAATNATKSADAVGYVKGVVTYMVMDDLAVKPMSTISSLTLLNTFNIRDVGALEEKVTSLDMPQGLKLLKASLNSKTVLTDVFLS